MDVSLKQTFQNQNRLQAKPEIQLYVLIRNIYCISSSFFLKSVFKCQTTKQMPYF
jgi:hypothetical protein